MVTKWRLRPDAVAQPAWCSPSPWAQCRSNEASVDGEPRAAMMAPVHMRPPRKRRTEMRPSIVVAYPFAVTGCFALDA